MFRKLFKRENQFNLYMSQYADAIEKAADEFARFIKVFDRAKLPEWVLRMKEIEHECDNITHKAISWLEGTFIVDYDKEDVHELVSDLDDIVDFMDAAATRISLYNLTKIIPAIVDLSQKLNSASHEVAKALREISKAKLNRKVLDICKNIKNYEEEGDSIYHSAVASLFKEGQNPLEVIKTKEIIEEIERSLDKCNQAAMNVESIVFKYS
jgi:uncharacterized protein